MDEPTGECHVMPLQRYEQGAEDLRAKTESGEYPPGSMLPGRARLGEISSVSGSVVDKAMMIVRMSGLTETLPGVGVMIRQK
jgi:DNA-binding GntR family transcriptional regulator